MNTLEEQVMYKVLKNINRDKSPGDAAPSSEYLKSLETLGLIKNDWDKTYLTAMGETMFNTLMNKIEKW